MKELFEEYYVKHNRESITLRQDLYKEYSFLFTDTDITNPNNGILRLYDNEKLFNSIIESHKKYRFLKEVLSIEEIVSRFPLYTEAANRGLIAGGIIAE